MADNPNDGNALEIDGREPAIKRAVILALGLVCIALPTWDLRHAFTEIGWWSLFVGVIVLGAWALGLVFLIGAIAGDGLHWAFRDDVLILKRSSPFRSRTDVLRAADVARTDVRAVTWDSGPDTYSVVLVLKKGEDLETPDQATRAAAEALELDIRRRLRLTN